MTRFLVAATALALTGAPVVTAQVPARPALLQQLDSIAAAPVKAGAVAGMAVAVVRGRDTLLYKGYGYADLENQVPATPATVFRIGSVTKQFTSAAVMQLVEQGKVSLDDDLSKYVPKYPVRGPRILVRHLMNHTSGIPSYTDIGAAFGNVSRLDLSHDSLVGIVAALQPQFPPGRHFYYNNTGYYMLGMLLEQVTGKSYAQYLDEQLFKPNGLAGTTYCDTRRLIAHRAQGYDRPPTGFVNTSFLSMDLPFAAGSLCSTVGDLVSWSQRLMSGRIVSPASYREMTTPVTLPTHRPMNYGYGLSADTLGGRRVVQHGGGINGFISSLVTVPSESLVVAVLANTSPAPSDQVANALMRAVLGLPPAPPPTAPKDLPVSAEERARYVGTYQLTRPDGSRQEVRVTEENGQLMLLVGTQRPARMMGQGGLVFSAPGAGRVAFEMAEGKVTGFVLGGGSRSLEAVRQ